MTEAVETRAEPSLKTVVVASAAGTAFEWYDFFVFGSLATVIARHFFADAGETVAYILALLTFGLGFIVRPLGALVFGWFGDRTGRKTTFLVTITLMGVATVAIALRVSMIRSDQAASWSRSKAAWWVEMTTQSWALRFSAVQSSERWPAQSMCSRVGPTTGTWGS